MYIHVANVMKHENRWLRQGYDGIRCYFTHQLSAPFLGFVQKWRDISKGEVVDRCHYATVLRNCMRGVLWPSQCDKMNFWPQLRPGLNWESSNPLDHNRLLPPTPPHSVSSAPQLLSHSALVTWCLDTPYSHFQKLIKDRWKELQQLQRTLRSMIVDERRPLSFVSSCTQSRK